MMSLEKEIKKMALQQIRGERKYLRPTKAYWFFIATGLTLAIAAYWSLLKSGAFISALIFFSLSYVCCTVLAISFGHQAFHASLFKSHRLGNLLGLLTFIPLGVDGRMWRKRHLEDHHPHPNTKGHDADLDNPFIFRLAPYTTRRWYHRYQHLYAPLAYCFGVVVTVFIDDPRALLKRCLLEKSMEGVLGFTVRKFTFAVIWFWIPLHLNLSLTGGQLLLILILGTIPSAWLFLPIAAAHLNRETNFYSAESQANFSVRQAETTVDFASDSRFMTMLYGGLNCHLAHHLWPNISSCYYRQMYQLLASSKLPNKPEPKNLSILQLFASHFGLLRDLGSQPSFFGAMPREE